MVVPGNMIMRWIKYYFIWLLTVFVAGCSTNQVNPVPSDFDFMMDIRSAEPGSAQNINIRIDAAGEGHFEIYDTEGVLRYDLNDIVTYEADQVVKGGDFELSESQLIQLWGSIDENKFFELTGDYRMAVGHSYAFILVQADGKRNRVDNIGMEVPEIRTMVEKLQAILPQGLDIEYGEGYVPEN